MCSPRRSSIGPHPARTRNATELRRMNAFCAGTRAFLPARPDVDRPVDNKIQFGCRAGDQAISARSPHRRPPRHRQRDPIHGRDRAPVGLPADRPNRSVVVRERRLQLRTKRCLVRCWLAHTSRCARGQLAQTPVHLKRLLTIEIGRQASRDLATEAPKAREAVQLTVVGHGIHVIAARYHRYPVATVRQ